MKTYNVHKYPDFELSFSEEQFLCFANRIAQDFDHECFGEHNSYSLTVDEAIESLEAGDFNDYAYEVTVC
jgi:hypothetical protein